MSELDEAWALALAAAEQQARVSGRGELAEYLALRNSNDLIRRTSIDWLLVTFTELAAQANRAGCSIQIFNSDGHRFKRGPATMVGQLLTLKSGVRTIFVEAGWPRTPRDGFVRGGGLACANIRHLGLSAVSEELLLMKSNTGAPSWVAVRDSESRQPVCEASLAHHLKILVDRK